MSQTDRELLELAAKAAGYNRFPGHAAQMVDSGWSPLADDGDALRLACILGLTVECDFHDSDTCTASETRGEALADEQSGMLGEVIGEPEFAATRRAIVRAAAEIGRALP